MSSSLPIHERRRKARSAFCGRLLRRTIEAALSLWVLYLVAINIFLSTPLFEKVIDGDPDTIDIHYRRGWSVLPGRIHARDLSIRGRDSNVEWILWIDQVTFDVSFVALTKKHFDVSRVRGKGVSFRLRQRLDAPPTSPEQVADLPPISGLAGYAVRPPKVESPDTWSDADYHLWSPHLEDVVAEDVRELWIDHHRLDGLSTVRGRFQLIPLRWVDIGPVNLEIHEGRASRGAAILVDGLGGTNAAVTVAPFDPRTASGNAIVHALTLDIDGHGTVPDLSRLPSPFPADVQIGGTADVRDLTLRVEGGVVKGGSHIESSVSSAILQGKHRLTSVLTLSADVTHAEPGDRLGARIEAARIDLGRAQTTPTKALGILNAKHAIITGDSGELDLVHPFSDLHVVADLPDIELPDARAIPAHWHGKTSMFRGGRARGRAHIEAWLAEQRGKLDVDVDAKDLDIQFPEFDVHGEASLSCHAAFGHGSVGGTVQVVSKHIGFAHRHLDIMGGIDAHANIRNFRPDHGDFVMDRAEANMTKLEVSHDDGKRAPKAERGPPALSIDAVTLRTEGFHFSPSEPLAHTHFSIGIVGGQMHDASIFDALSLADPSLTPSDPASPNVSLKADNSRFAGEGWVDTAARVAKGHAALHVENVGIGKVPFHIHGDVTASADFSNWNLDRDTLALDAAKVAITHVHGGFHPNASEMVAERIEASGRAPILDLRRPALGDFEGRVQVVNAKFLEAKSLQSLLPAGSILAIESGGARASADITIFGAKRASDGAVRIQLSQAGVRLHETQLVGDFGIMVRVHGFVPERDAETSSAGDDHRLKVGRGEAADLRLIDLAGSRIQMRNVGVSHATTETAHWSGDALFDEATLRLGPRPEFDGHLTVLARDASPLLAILLRNSLPKVLADLTHTPHLSASTRFTVGPHYFSLRQVDAHGGDLAVRGIYAVRDEHRHGAFIVEKGVLSVGIAMSDAGTHVRFFGLDGWMRDETRLTAPLLEDAPASAPTPPTRSDSRRLW